MEHEREKKTDGFGGRAEGQAERADGPYGKRTLGATTDPAELASGQGVAKTGGDYHSMLHAARAAESEGGGSEGQGARTRIGRRPGGAPNASIGRSRWGEALREISADREIVSAMFEVLEIQRLLASPARITLLPGARSESAVDRGVLVAQLASRGTAGDATATRRAALEGSSSPPPASTARVTRPSDDAGG